jgi:hypothetical protein
MGGYHGPVRIVSLWGDIEVTVDLRADSGSDGRRTWSGYLDRCDRDRIRRAMEGMGVHALVIRFSNGDEGNVIPSPEMTWSFPASASVGSCEMRGSHSRQLCLT